VVLRRSPRTSEGCIASSPFHPYICETFTIHSGLLRNFSFLFLALALLDTTVSGQVPPPPKREVRAVWLATGGLDWPKSTDPTEQQHSLRSILYDLHRANFNTVFFQIRTRGDAYYRSAYEPWAENLTGVLGRDPGWDPLAFLLTEAHALGIEVHGWFNVYKVRGLNAVSASTPLHVTRAHPQWSVPDGGELWLDPGNPLVRRYLINVAVNLIQQYELDGINFDYIRYPNRTFSDQETYRKYGAGMDRDAWRRTNIDAFVAEFAARSATIRPMLKIGSSPFGVFETDPVSNTLGSYHAVYQDSEAWLRRGLQDYLSPQIYWDIGPSKGDPDFARLARRWQAGTSGRHIYAGIGVYKPEVLREVIRQIDVSREAGNQGQAFFRLENVRSLDMFGNRYASPALIPPMPWKDSLPPLPPSNLAVAEVTTNVFHLEWTPSARAADGDSARRYLIYRSSLAAPRTDIAPNIVAVVPASANYYLDTLTIPSGLSYYYAVTALDKGNNESVPSTVGTGVVRELLALDGKLSNVTTFSVSFGQGSATPTLLAYRVPDRRHVTLEILQEASGGKKRVFAVLVNGEEERGTHIVGVSQLRVPSGNYTLKLRAGEAIVEQPLNIGP
jgi:uncharacterized lipoprotein YddW (UPF0748 family)